MYKNAFYTLVNGGINLHIKKKQISK